MSASPAFPDGENHASPGPTQDPPLTGPRTCDASGMIMIHRVFRGAVRVAPDLARGVHPGDTAHAGRVADHLTLMATALHEHHEAEDSRLWSTLTERAPGCAQHVERMRLQHGKRSTPRGQMWNMLGTIMSHQPDSGAAFLAENLPAPARVIWRRIGAPRYARYRAGLLTPTDTITTAA